MELRKAKTSEIPQIKQLVDSYEEMDVLSETFPQEYYERILEKGILLVAVTDDSLVGACFGNYNTRENWADLLGLVVEENSRNKGVGSSLVKEFEKIVREKGLGTIDLYADKNQVKLFSDLGYAKGREFVAFRKKL